jgi:Zn-dependent peptidase ImmA (M78 family)
VSDTDSRHASKAEIQELARRTLREHGLYAVPVNPIAVAQKLGVRLLNAVFAEPRFSGLTAKRSGITTVLVRQLDHAARKRFTIAHELAHTLLHLSDADEEIVDTDADFFRTSDELQAEWSNERRREYEANVFAAELLMPEDLVRKVWRELLPENQTAADMAYQFQVSESAMGIRLKELGLV